MARFLLTKVTPDYDDPEVYVLQKYEFRSVHKLTQYAEECLRRLIPFVINQMVDRHYQEMCSYNYFCESGLEFSSSCPFYLKYHLSLVSKANGIYSFSNNKGGFTE